MQDREATEGAMATEEWRSQLGSSRTQCRPPIPSYLGMKVRGLVV